MIRAQVDERWLWNISKRTYVPRPDDSSALVAHHDILRTIGAGPIADAFSSSSRRQKFLGTIQHQISVKTRNCTFGLDQWPFLILRIYQGSCIALILIIRNGYRSIFGHDRKGCCNAWSHPHQWLPAPPSAIDHWSSSSTMNLYTFLLLSLL